mmetsp:Transcript_15538/g.19845  ORF Transcript_15538/g.19845 Transcript_15538/m.19845 type:complete len:85 (+) Transcript_15538:726-980(+)
MRLVDLLGESQDHQFNLHTAREVQWVDHMDMDEVMVVLIVAEVIMAEGAIMAVEDIIVTMGAEDEEKDITVEVSVMDHTLGLLE